jgi:hypothetical protein
MVRRRLLNPPKPALPVRSSRRFVKRLARSKHPRTLTRSPANQLLLFDGGTRTPEFLDARGHRAIGVVYQPELESSAMSFRACCPGGMMPSCTSRKRALCIPCTCPDARITK